MTLCRQKLDQWFSDPWCHFKRNPLTFSSEFKKNEMLPFENEDMCLLCFSSEDVIRLKNCKHEICLKCLSANDMRRCPVEGCETALHIVDIHRKKIYVRSLETLARKHLWSARLKVLGLRESN
jgi:hypothetical protein